jgi:hypothetical protein
MTSFVPYHPGGIETIMLGANRHGGHDDDNAIIDCTPLFQSYHPFNIQKVKAILNKYEIHKEETNTNQTNNKKVTKNEQEEEKKSEDLSDHHHHPSSNRHHHYDSKTIKTTSHNINQVHTMNHPELLVGHNDHHFCYHENDLFYTILCQRVYHTFQTQYHMDPIQHRTATYPRICFYIFLFIGTIVSTIGHCMVRNYFCFCFAVYYLV